MNNERLVKKVYNIFYDNKYKIFTIDETLESLAIRGIKINSYKLSEILTYLIEKNLIDIHYKHYSLVRR